ncbi:MAG: hypothetical protein NTY90_05710 [Candidatus Micrarchaeota archaeon]|nr:hypothetical protein [Candidatus Micrarchaeota archaeon]
MEQKVICHTVSPATSVEGKRMFAVLFGIKMDQMKHQTQQGIPVLWDNRIQIFVDEEVWEKMDPKFVVGDAYKLRIEGGAITLKK